MFLVESDLIVCGTLITAGTQVDESSVESRVVVELRGVVYGGGPVKYVSDPDQITREDSTAPVVKPAPKPAKGGPKPSMASEPGTRPRT